MTERRDTRTRPAEPSGGPRRDARPAPSRPAYRIGRRPPPWVRPVLVTVTLAVAFGVGTWLIAFSSVLDVRTVRVTGVSLLDDADVTAAADVTLAEPLARTDVDAIRARIARLPEIEDVTVSRSWPHTVAIEVTERTAAAVLADDSTYQLLDGKGIPYHAVTEVPDGLLPVRVPDEAPMRRAGVTVAAALPPELAEQVEYVHGGTRDSLTLQLLDGVRVMWGSADDSERKAEVLLALLRDAGETDGEPVAVYDVRVPDRPTTKI